MSGESEEIDAGEALARLNTLFRESAEAGRETPIDTIVVVVLQEHSDDDI